LLLQGTARFLALKSCGQQPFFFGGWDLRWSPTKCICIYIYTIYVYVYMCICICMYMLDIEILCADIIWCILYTHTFDWEFAIAIKLRRLQQKKWLAVGIASTSLSLAKLCQ
jgi:hypothetical protein